MCLPNWRWTRRAKLCGGSLWPWRFRDSKQLARLRKRILQVNGTVALRREPIWQATKRDFQMTMTGQPSREAVTLQGPLGVVLVAYDSADVIIDALESLFAAAQSDQVALRVVVVDNASPDDSVERIRAWQSGESAYSAPVDLPFSAPPVVAKPISEPLLQILRAGHNGGFAAGVNLGVAALFSQPEINRVWVLNPDSVVPPGTVGAYARFDPGPFSLMGGRVLYFDRPDIIQIDGGRINLRTGVAVNINLHKPRSTPLPQPEELDFVMGASMVVSRQFWERVGPMREDYFLYYEEVDWALSRGDLPLAVCPEAVIHHRAGTAIGSPIAGRPASPFSLYFKHRGRMMFLRRHAPQNMAIGWAYTVAKIAQLAVKGYWQEARALFAGACRAAPPAAVAERLDPEALRSLRE